jgi:hypothetical protein
MSRFRMLNKTPSEDQLDAAYNKGKLTERDRIRRIVLKHVSRIEWDPGFYVRDEITLTATQLLDLIDGRSITPQDVSRTITCSHGLAHGYTVHDCDGCCARYNLGEKE